MSWSMSSHIKQGWADFFRICPPPPTLKYWGGGGALAPPVPTPMHCKPAPGSEDHFY